MGLFTSKTKVKDPLAGQKAEAANWLLDLLKSGTPNIPIQQIAGLTDTQQAIQSGLKSQYANLNANYDTARGYYTDVINDQYDPRTSDYYQGLRQEAGDLKTEASNDVRQSANLGGMLQSTPRMAVESENRRKIDNQTLTLLGGMYETERNRKENAIGNLGQIDAQQAQSTGMLSQIADQERSIEQARNDALYNQALQTILFPYQYQAQLASAIFGASQPVVTGGGMTDLGFLVSAGASLAGGYFGAKSDIRVKENIDLIDNAIDKVKQLKGYTFNYKVNPPEIRNGGVMAQELEKVLPDAVSETDGIKYVKYDAVIGLLVSAVSELTERIK